MDIMKLMKQSKNIKKLQNEISNAEVSEEINGAKLILSGKGNVKDFEISEELFLKGRTEVEKTIEDVIVSCLKKQLDLYKSKVKDVMGGIDISSFMS